MILAEPAIAVMTDHFQPGFQVQNSYSALLHINVIGRYSQGFRDTTPQTEQEPDEKPVPETSGCPLQLSDLFWF